MPQGRRLPRQHYYYAGSVERFTPGGRLTKRAGWCGVTTEGTDLQPWVTRAEAQAQCRLGSKRAVFHDGRRDAVYWAKQGETTWPTIDCS